MSINQYTTRETFIVDGEQWFTIEFPVKCQICGVIYERQQVGTNNPADFESIEREVQQDGRCSVHADWLDELGIDAILKDE